MDGLDVLDEQKVSLEAPQVRNLTAHMATHLNKQQGVGVQPVQQGPVRLLGLSPWKLINTKTTTTSTAITSTTTIIFNVGSLIYVPLPQQMLSLMTPASLSLQPLHADIITTTTTTSDHHKCHHHRSHYSPPHHLLSPQALTDHNHHTLPLTTTSTRTPATVTLTTIITALTTPPLKTESHYDYHPYNHNHPGYHYKHYSLSCNPVRTTITRPPV